MNFVVVQLVLNRSCSYLHRRRPVTTALCRRMTLTTSVKRLTTPVVAPITPSATATAYQHCIEIVIRSWEGRHQLFSNFYYKHFTFHLICVVNIQLKFWLKLTLLMLLIVVILDWVTIVSTSVYFICWLFRK